MEIKFGSFQETILEIVQIEEHAIDIELRLRIAMGEVKSTCTTNLYVRQFTDGAFQEFLFLQGISSASFTSSTYSIKEGSAAQIGLDITQLIAAGCQYLWYWELALGEMLCQVDESMVFVATCTNHTYDSLTVLIRQTKISTVTTCTWKLLDVRRFSAFPLSIEFYEFIHNVCKDT